MAKVDLEYMVLSDHPEILLALAAKVAMCWVNCRLSWTRRPRSLVQGTVGIGLLEGLK